MQLPTMTGDYPSIERVRTNILSMDVALGNVVMNKLGMPMRTYYEVYGRPHVGKSTLSYFLSAVSAGNRKIALCDIEGMDRDYILRALGLAGYEGEVTVTSLDTHEKMLMRWASHLADDSSFGAGIMDSVGAITPIMEAEGDFGEAFMGRRAKLVAQLVRRLSTGLSGKKTPSVAFITNHVHDVLGGHGIVTAGGETLKYLAGVRINIKVKEVITSSDDKQPIAYLMQGTVDKLRYGGKGRIFYCINIPGYGISRNLSAMFDCFEYDLAERSTTVKINGNSIGRISKLIEEEKNGNNFVFMPFYEVLNEYEQSTFSENRPVDDSGNETTEMESPEPVQE